MVEKGWRCGRQAIGRWTDVAMVVRLCGAAHAVLPAAVHRRYRRRRRLPHTTAVLELTGASRDLHKDAWSS